MQIGGNYGDVAMGYGYQNKYQRGIENKAKYKTEIPKMGNIGIPYTDTENDTNTENGYHSDKEKRGIAAVRPLENTLEIKGKSVRGESLTNHVNNKSKVPYSYLAQNGIVEYNGVIFVCDEEKNALCLGDMSNEKDVLTIPMSNGGVLKVNRDNLGDLSSAIGMFSPEDVRRILEAMAQDNKAQQTLQEIEEDKNMIGDGNTNTANGESIRSQEQAEREVKTGGSSLWSDKLTFENGNEITEETSEEASMEVTEEMLGGCNFFCV